MKRLVMISIFCVAGFGCSSQSRSFSAEEILQPAYDRAAKEHKNVFVIFHASWCVWCHKMDSSMNDKTCRKFFEENYVTCHLTVDESKGKEWMENPGAKELMKKYNGVGAGIPYWLVFDKDRKLLAGSRMRPEGAGLEATGENTGCPANKAEVDHFIKVLKKTSRLTVPELSVIAKRFSENAVN